MTVLCSCSQKETVNPSQLIRYVEDKANGLRKEITAGEFVYTFQYKPSDYIVCKEVQDIGTDSVSFHARQKQLEKTVWFNLSIRSVKGAENPLKYKVSGIEEYNSRLNYFLALAPLNFQLNYGDEGEMKPVGYFFENNYGLTPMDVLIVGFIIPDTRPMKDLTLEYDDQLFGNSALRVRISMKDLETIPGLILNHQ